MNNSFVIFGDSTSSLDKETRMLYNIEYLKMSVTSKDVEKTASLDWELFTSKEFYDIMRNGDRIITGQVTIPEFENQFSKWLEQGKDILYISCSSALSGSYNTSKRIREELLKKYTNRKIYCIDALNSSMGQGLMCIKASLMREEGKTIDEIAEYIENNKLSVLQFGTTENLTYLSRAGRVKASKAFFGNLFGVKPIIISNDKGENVAWKKAKGRKGSIDFVADCIKEYIINPQDQYVYVTHGDSLEDAMLLSDEIKKAVPNIKGVKISTLDPIVGASTGPGTLIAYCIGKQIKIEGEDN